MQKNFTIERLQSIIETVPMGKEGNRTKLVDSLFKEMEPFLSKGIENVDEELDFCSLVDVMLDEGGVVNQDIRSNTLSQIYDAVGFTHFYER